MKTTSGLPFCSLSSDGSHSDGGESCGGGGKIGGGNDGGCGLGGGDSLLPALRD